MVAQNNGSEVAVAGVNDISTLASAPESLNVPSDGHD